MVLANYQAGERLVPDAVPNAITDVDPAQLAGFRKRSILVVNSSVLQLFFVKLRLGLPI